MKTFCAVLLVGTLVLLAGCEDLTAQGKATEAAAQVNALKKQLDDAMNSNQSLAKNVESLRTEMNSKVDARLEAVAKDLDVRQKQYLDDVKAITEKAVKEAVASTDRLRADYDASFAGAKTSMAADVQKLRDELKTASEELRKFMDNQLRELYPYAYQPRRLDANTPPPAEAK